MTCTLQYKIHMRVSIALKEGGLDITAVADLTVVWVAARRLRPFIMIELRFYGIFTYYYSQQLIHEIGANSNLIIRQINDCFSCFNLNYAPSTYFWNERVLESGTFIFTNFCWQHCECSTEMPDKLAWRWVLCRMRREWLCRKKDYKKIDLAHTGVKTHYF